MKTQYLEIAALLSAAIVSEMASLRAEETYPQRNADEMDDFLGLQREKIRNLHASRMNVEAIAAGYAGGDDDKPEVKQDSFLTRATKVNDEIMKDVLRHGIGVMRVSLDEFFKEERKTGESHKAQTDKVPPSENKAQSAAFAAGQRANTAAADANAAYDAAVASTAAVATKAAAEWDAAAAADTRFPRK